MAEDAAASPPTDDVPQRPGTKDEKKPTPSEIRVLVCGTAKCGKSTFLRNFRDKNPRKKYKPTFYQHYNDKFVQVLGHTIHIDAWDTGVEGHENIGFMRCDAAIICFDISDPDSMKSITSTNWFKAAMKHKAVMPFILVGLRSDLRGQAKQQLAQDSPPKDVSHFVLPSEAEAFAETIGAIGYMETSGVTGHNVKKIFERLTIESVINPEADWTEVLPYSTEEDDKKEKLRGSCCARTLQNTFRYHSDRPCVGTRLRKPDGTFDHKYTYITYKQFGDRATNFGCGLRYLGLETYDFVALCCPNAVEWLIADAGCMMYGFVTVTVHYTFPEDDTDFVVEQANIKAIITSSGLLPRFGRSAQKHKHLHYIVQLDGEQVSEEHLKEFGNDVKILHITEVEKLGAENPHNIVLPDPNALFTVMYTSGSTGRPKGVMISEKAHNEDIGIVAGQHVNLLWEPLSHSERVNTYRRMLGGSRIGIFDRDIGQDLFEDIQVIRPTSLISVPRFWNVLYAEYQKMLSLYKSKNPKKDTKKCDQQVRAYFTNILGGRLWSIATGGAPTSKTVYNWLFGFKAYVGESYGTMEVGGIAGSKAIFRDVEHRIEDVPEMGYTSQDKPYPRGELVVKAKGMALGYFKNEEETQKAFKDGWYYTGDIVAVEKNGYVRVIDRKKDIFKLAQGEFVSPVRCEAVFHQSKFVEQICVYGDSLKNYLVAVIVPNEGVLTRWAAEENLSANCFEELCALPEVNDLILKDMEACALLNKLRAYEKVRKIIVSSDRFTVANGQMTATNKLNRRAIIVHYKQRLLALYDQPDRPSAARSSLTRSGRSVTSQMKLEAVMQKVLPFAVGGEHTQESLLDLGMDSLSAISLVNSIKQEFEVDVPLEALYKTDMNVETLATVLEHQQDIEPEEAYLHDLDIYNFLGTDLVPKKPTAPTLDSLIGSDALNAAIEEEEAERDAAQNATQESASSEVTTSCISANGTKGEAVSSGAEKRAGDGSEKPSEASDVKKEDKDEAKESVLPDRKLKPLQILLTGVTGFLGAFLLQELLAQTPDRVFCLVRAENEDAAQAKIMKHLTDMKIVLTEEQLDRVGILVGDLSKPKFGWDDDTWAPMSSAIDEIFHCGAWVNGVLPYSVLRPTNVLGTVEVIRFALSGTKNRKSIHYVSTLSTVQPMHVDNYSRFIGESSVDVKRADFFRNMGGYPLSKLVSEVLLTEVGDKILDLRVYIYRPGSISGCSATGAANIEAYINKLLVGITTLGYYPNSKGGGAKIRMDWAPVDYVAKSIVHIGRSGPMFGIFHMNNPYSIYSITMDRLANYIRSFGYHVDPISLNKWRRKLYKDMDREDKPNALKPLRSYFDDGFPGDLMYSCLNTMESVRDSPHECPLITEEIVHRYLQFWVDRGILPKPKDLKLQFLQEKLKQET